MKEVPCDKCRVRLNQIIMHAMNKESVAIAEIFKKNSSSSSHQKVEHILDQINRLNDVEKLLLYLKLPCGDSTERELSSSAKIDITKAQQWIETHLREHPELVKDEVFDEYSEFCRAHGIRSVSREDFGKLMKTMFPEVQARRLGTRGKTRHCYGGLATRYELNSPSTPSIAFDESSDTPTFDEKAVELGTDDDRKWNTDVRELAHASCSLICEWAEKLLHVKFPTIYDIADYLIEQKYVKPESLASYTIKSHIQSFREHFNLSSPKAAEALDASSVSSGCSSPSVGSTRARGAKAKLQQKLQQKGRLKQQKQKLEKQRSQITYDDSSSQGTNSNAAVEHDFSSNSLSNSALPSYGSGLKEGSIGTTSVSSSSRSNRTASRTGLSTTPKPILPKPAMAASPVIVQRPTSSLQHESGSEMEHAAKSVILVSNVPEKKANTPTFQLVPTSQIVSKQSHIYNTNSVASSSGIITFSNNFQPTSTLVSQSTSSISLKSNSAFQNGVHANTAISHSNTTQQIPSRTCDIATTERQPQDRFNSNSYISNLDDSEANDMQKVKGVMLKARNLERMTSLNVSFGASVFRDKYLDSVAMSKSARATPVGGLSQSNADSENIIFRPQESNGRPHSVPPYVLQEYEGSDAINSIPQATSETNMSHFRVLNVKNEYDHYPESNNFSEAEDYSLCKQHNTEDNREETTEHNESAMESSMIPITMQSIGETGCHSNSLTIGTDSTSVSVSSTVSSTLSPSLNANPVVAFPLNLADVNVNSQLLLALAQLLPNSSTALGAAANASSGAIKKTKTVSSLLREQRVKSTSPESGSAGTSAGSGSNPGATNTSRSNYAHDNRPVSQLLRERREKMQLIGVFTDQSPDVSQSGLHSDVAKKITFSFSDTSAPGSQEDNQSALTMQQRIEYEANLMSKNRIKKESAASRDASPAHSLGAATGSNQDTPVLRGRRGRRALIRMGSVSAGASNATTPSTSREQSPATSPLLNVGTLTKRGQRARMSRDNSPIGSPIGRPIRTRNFSSSKVEAKTRSLEAKKRAEAIKSEEAARYKHLTMHNNDTKNTTLAGAHSLLSSSKPSAINEEGNPIAKSLPNMQQKVPYTSAQEQLALEELLSPDYSIIGPGSVQSFYSSTAHNGAASNDSFESTFSRSRHSSGDVSLRSRNNSGDVTIKKRLGEPLNTSDGSGHRSFASDSVCAALNNPTLASLLSSDVGPQMRNRHQQLKLLLQECNPADPIAGRALQVLQSKDVSFSGNLPCDSSANQLPSSGQINALLNNHNLLSQALRAADSRNPNLFVNTSRFVPIDNPAEVNTMSPIRPRAIVPSERSLATSGSSFTTGQSQPTTMTDDQLAQFLLSAKGNDVSKHMNFPPGATPGPGSTPADFSWGFGQSTVSSQNSCFVPYISTVTDLTQSNSLSVNTKSEISTAPLIQNMNTFVGGPNMKGSPQTPASFKQSINTGSQNDGFASMEGVRPPAKRHWEDTTPNPSLSAENKAWLAKRHRNMSDQTQSRRRPNNRGGNSGFLPPMQPLLLKQGSSTSLKAPEPIQQESSNLGSSHESMPMLSPQVPPQESPFSPEVQEIFSSGWGGSDMTDAGATNDPGFRSMSVPAKSYFDETLEEFLNLNMKYFEGQVEGDTQPLQMQQPSVSVENFEQITDPQNIPSGPLATQSTAYNTHNSAFLRPDSYAMSSQVSTQYSQDPQHFYQTSAMQQPQTQPNLLSDAGLMSNQLETQQQPVNFDFQTRQTQIAGGGSFEQSKPSSRGLFSQLESRNKQQQVSSLRNLLLQNDPDLTTQPSATESFSAADKKTQNSQLIVELLKQFTSGSMANRKGALESTTQNIGAVQKMEKPPIASNTGARQRGKTKSLLSQFLTADNNELDVNALQPNPYQQQTQMQQQADSHTNMSLTQLLGTGTSLQVQHGVNISQLNNLRDPYSSRSNHTTPQQSRSTTPAHFDPNTVSMYLQRPQGEGGFQRAAEMPLTGSEQDQMQSLLSFGGRMADNMANNGMQLMQSVENQNTAFGSASGGQDPIMGFFGNEDNDQILQGYS